MREIKRDCCKPEVQITILVTNTHVVPKPKWRYQPIFIQMCDTYPKCTFWRDA